MTVKAEARHLILLSVDTLRYDCVAAQQCRPHLEVHGLERNLQTPHLDRLCEEGTAFLEAVTTAPYTTSAHTSMLTGLYPPRHGVREFFKHAVAPSCVLLQEWLSRHGFRTVARPDHPSLLRPFGLLRGFDVLAESDAELQCAVRQMREERLFIFIHALDVHCAYGHSRDPADREMNGEVVAEIQKLAGQPLSADPTDASAVNRLLLRVRSEMGEGPELYREMLRFYLWGVNRFDRRRLARLLDIVQQAGLLDSALLILVSDHGEGHSGDAYPSHSGWLREDAIRVPMILRGPGVPRGKNVREPVSLVDLMPTALDALGIAPPEEAGPMDGVSLLHGALPAERWAYAEVFRAGGELNLNLPLADAERKKLVLERHQHCILSHRMIRRPGLKACVRGVHEPSFLRSTRACPDPEFVQALYQRWAGRYPDASGLDTQLRKLSSAWWRRRRRSILFRDFNRGEEMAALPKYALFDLTNDPLEEWPRAFLPGEEGWEEFEPYLARIEEFAARPVEGVEIHFEDEQAASCVEAALRSLGYL